MLSLGLAALWLAAPASRAAEVTRVVSALDPDNPFDFNLTISYLHQQKSAFIKRESVASHTATDGTQIFSNQLLKDLQYAQTRDILNLRADFGIFRDVSFHIDAPIVLRDDRTLSFDQSARNTSEGCHFPGEVDPMGQPYAPTCVNASNSTVLADGILPGAGKPQYGIDAVHPDRNGFSDPSSTVFRGPTRAGIEYLGLGLTWAPFNQARDDTKPTWTLGFDSRLDVGKDARFDPSDPGANTAVGLGYHQLVFSTAVSKRFRYFDPYFAAYYMLPIRSTNSPYQHYAQGSQTSVNPQQRASVMIGVEQIAWENPHAFQRVTVEVRGHVDEHFFGRSQSEMWEALAGSSKCTGTIASADPNCRASLDYDPVSGKAMPYPGITETEAYASFGGDAGVNIQVGKYVRFRGLFGLTIDQPHFITFANAGKDLHGQANGSPDGRVNLNDAQERNPVYRESIDTPGRRFKVEGTEIWSLFLEGSLMF
jgi:hypothetical protein